MPESKSISIYDYIEQMRQRPEMFTGGSLAPIENLLFGYEVALNNHGIVEEHHGRRFTVSSFSEWLYETKGWSTNLGFSFAIEENTRETAPHLDVFFDLVSEYQKSTASGQSN
ncbi:hypothetical protein [Cognatiyoonia sp. IB215182]|uniref:hypothetical protein n=1 Tax=Cognatiyoonia sp. IB215182 TaxID=3097353 RepID=UPI002A12BEA1|nr:hypothetical protein [Cognatiyoonia sp. IB215182]MDX8352095.1 hypothetical protein [Cognatiyoonia sp. IB215182]